MDWQVRKAKLDDARLIVVLARGYNEFLMPYVLNEFVVRNYINQFMIAETPQEVGGAVHYIDADLVDSDSLDDDAIRDDGVCSFLLHVKQVPPDIIREFVGSSIKLAFLGQIVCPGKGSFYAILEELKKRYDELWCWMSVAGPSYKSYLRYGFQFSESREFWNIYKNDYSTFSLGRWVR